MNVQNIPRDDKVVKRAFVPKLDALFFADYPNIELKLLAYYLNEIGCPEMAEFFNDKSGHGDLHIRTAAGMYSVSDEAVTDLQRQKGKRCNFSIVYGGGTPTLIQQRAAKDFAEASDMLHRFHTAWPGIGWESPVKRQFGLKPEAAKGTLTDLIKSKVNERGYITTLWGRHLHPRSTHSALNALLQGGAADLMKWAMIQVHGWLKANNMKSHIVNMVHDELMLDAAKDELPALAITVPDLMVYAPLEAIVPIKPDPDVSWTSWAEKEPYDPTNH